MMYSNSNLIFQLTCILNNVYCLPVSWVGATFVNLGVKFSNVMKNLLTYISSYTLKMFSGEKKKKGSGA